PGLADVARVAAGQDQHRCFRSILEGEFRLDQDAAEGPHHIRLLGHGEDSKQFSLAGHAKHLRRSGEVQQLDAIEEQHSHIDPGPGWTFRLIRSASPGNRFASRTDHERQKDAAKPTSGHGLTLSRNVSTTAPFGERFAAGYLIAWGRGCESWA